ncbi:uncharacterized protein BT62DRAFT_532297 [Guyanagaster necrorhizus]|uniref:Uncharacterized protein n=1 Tax=Guyanagaster necrorhizus TaxID=856835 RepID=A0A9P8AX13_9AGAR|nr:uncharacterized protein BT62DRAFT_532297 [Guyanagaster necrorhizus MCA 3950]KAG7450726.1 hypothetical protein BT62DRAFT_532297 [Guyanagaster necrorhizus MCA 3950]
MLHCDPKTYVLPLFVISHAAFLVSAAPVRNYTKRLADGEVKTVKRQAANNENPGLLPALENVAAPSGPITSSISGNSELSSLFKEVAKLASGTTVINVNVGDKNLGSLLSDAASDTNPSGGAGSDATTDTFGDTASGGDDTSPPEETGDADGFGDDATVPSVPSTTGNGLPSSTSNPGSDAADDDDDGDMDTKFFDSAVQGDSDGDDESDTDTSSDSLYLRSGAVNGTAASGSNSTDSIDDSYSDTSGSTPHSGSGGSLGEAPAGGENGTSIFKISVQNIQKINIEKGTVTS